MTWRSPGLELNDIGFQYNADEINHYFWLGYNETDPKGIFRSWRANYTHGASWDFGGNPLHQSFNLSGQAEFKNFWGINAGFNKEFLDNSNNWLRGGPTFRKPIGIGANFRVYSNARKR